MLEDELFWLAGNHVIAVDPLVIPSVASTHGSSEDMIDALAPRDSPKMENKSIVTMDLISMISGCCVENKKGSHSGY